MRKLYPFFTGVGVLLLSLFSPTLTEVKAQESNLDQTLSPCIEVLDSSINLETLPLKSTDVDVTISGVIANVTVKQVYINTGEVPIEANYVFPASTNAAVYGMQMQLGNRILIAKIEEKEKAQEIYDEAKEEGRTASLLEQHRPNVFQMHVANILPDDTINVILKYTELLVPSDAIYEFVFPTVVGPRYSGRSIEDWNTGPFTGEGVSPTYTFKINVTINAGMAINKVSSPSHINSLIDINNPVATCKLPDDDLYSGNKDFILRYQLSGDEIQTGMLLYESEDENFFLAMIQPPERPEEADMPPREYVFLMDVSGSMNGFPIETSKVLLSNILNTLRYEDRFNILFFAGGSTVFSSESVMATEDNISAAIKMVENQSGGGGTEMLSAIKRAIDMPGTEGFSRTFVISTDGYVSFDREVIEYLQNHLDEANFFPFGIGSSMNRYVIEGMAHAGMGEPFVATDADEAVAMAEKFETYIQTPVLTNIDLIYDEFMVYDVMPQKIPDVFAERPIIVFGKYTGEPNGSVGVSGTTGAANYYQELSLNNFNPSESNEALKYLWARKKIQILDDYANVSYDQEGELKQEITALGLKYNLLTRYTSFIAVDSVIRCAGCDPEEVNQPLPLPEGVSDYAVGGEGVFAASYLYNTADNDKLKNISSIYPNPVSNESVIRFYADELLYLSNHELKIYDSLGRLVALIKLEGLVSGYNEIPLNIADYSLKTGVYYVHLVLNGQIADKVTFLYNK